MRKNSPLSSSSLERMKLEVGVSNKDSRQRVEEFRPSTRTIICRCSGGGKSCPMSDFALIS